MSAEVGALQARGGTVVRLAGLELREPATLFAAFARELSFPGYFGYNWYALVDCLHDWHGHGAESRDLAVLIDGADDLARTDFLGLFVVMRCDAAWRANLQMDADGIPQTGLLRQPFALHFVFSWTRRRWRTLRSPPRPIPRSKSPLSMDV
ncbi:barstar family protein [Micromonosporaceae bacterium Da 78-11]